MSRLNNIQSSYGKSFSFAIANTYSYNVMNASKLPASTMIVSSQLDNAYEDLGQHSVIVTDIDGNPVRLTYDITEGNGLKFTNDSLSISIDKRTIIEKDKKLQATFSRIIDNSTIKAFNDKIYVNKDNLEKTSSNNFGLAKVDGKTIKSDNGEIYVETEKLDHASNTLAGIIKPDNRTIISSNGVLSIVPNELTRGTNLTYGTVKVDGTTIISDNGTLHVTHDSLKNLDNSGLRLVKADNDTLVQNNGIISVNENAIPYASQFSKGKVKIDDSQFYVDGNGTLHPKNVNPNSLIYDYDEALELLEKRTAKLEDTINEGITATQPEIYSLSCNETTTTALEKPEYLEEPIEMPVQHVYVSLNVITNCDFNISVRYDDNEPPTVELKDINYNDEIKKNGIEAIDAVWPSTQMTEKNIILLFDTKNFFSSSAGKTKTTKITIFVKSIDDITAQKEIVYSIVRYNSNFKHDEIEKDEYKEYVQELSSNYSIISDKSHWRMEGIGADDSQHTLNETVLRRDIYDITSRGWSLIFHGEYVDNSTNISKWFEQKINVDLLDSNIWVGKDEDTDVYFCKYLIRYVTEDDVDLFYNLKYEAKSQNITYVSPTELTIYSMHAKDIICYQYVKEDENSQPVIREYIDETNDAFIWNNTYATYIMTYYAGNNNEISHNISDDIYSANSLVLKSIGNRTAKTYFTGNSQQLNVYFKPYKEADSDVPPEQISECLTISYKNVVPSLSVNITNATYTYEEPLNITGTIEYSYTLDDETYYVDLDNIDTEIVLPLNFKINGNTTNFIVDNNEFVATIDNYNGNNTFSYSFEYQSVCDILPSIEAMQGTVQVETRSNPLLIDTTASSINYSNGVVSINDIPNYDDTYIRGLDPSVVASYIPTHLIVAYDSSETLVSPQLTTSVGNKFNVVSLNEEVSYSIYDVSSNNATIVSEDILGPNLIYTSENSVINKLVTAYAVAGNSTSDILSFYFGPVIDAPIPQEYIKYFYDGNIHSYMKVANVSPYRLDRIGDTYFSPNKNYYFIDSLTMTSHMTYNLSNKINTQIPSSQSNEIIEFVSANNTLTFNGQNAVYLWKFDINQSFIVSVNNSVNYLDFCYLFKSSDTELDLISFNDNGMFSLDIANSSISFGNIQNNINSNSIICLKSKSTDGLTVSKEHYYLLPQNVSNDTLSITDITNVINCAEFIISYMIMHDNCYSLDPIEDIQGFSSNSEFSSALSMIGTMMIDNSTRKFVIQPQNNGVFEVEDNQAYNLFMQSMNNVDTVNCFITIYPNGATRRTTIFKVIPVLNKFKNHFEIAKLNGFNVPYLNSIVFDDLLTPYDYAFEISNTKITSQSDVTFNFKYHGLTLYSYTMNSSQIISNPNDGLCEIFKRDDLGINISFSYQNGTFAYTQTNTVIEIGNNYQDKLRDICGLSSSLRHKKIEIGLESNVNVGTLAYPVTSYDIFLSNDASSTYWKLCDYELKKFELCYVNGNPSNYNIDTPYYYINSYTIGIPE